MKERTVRNAVLQANKKGWDHIIIAVDLHNTVINSDTYNQMMDAGGEQDLAILNSMYGLAVPALQVLSRREDVKLYWFSGTDKSLLKDISYWMKETHNIVFDGIYPPTGESIREGQSFDKKPCYDLLLDDKSGFDPDFDWINLTKSLSNCSVTSCK